MDIINYRIKQYSTIDIGEILQRNECGSVTGS